MEKFKAVEKAMKTKAYSKEGLSAAAKLDPKEQAKVEASDFLSSMVDELEQQIEALEAESESIQATMKKGKGHGAKADRMAEIERIIERHKWHQGKLELIQRSLQNGGVDTDQVTDLEESIRYYVSDGMNDDFMEDDTMYDDLNLDEDEDAFGMIGDNDKVSSQDTQSVQEEPVEVESRSSSIPGGKPRTVADNVSAAGGRRPSTQLKSPLPTLATLHTPLPTISNGAPSNNTSMKPASVPARPAEGLKYASAAAAAAANDKNNVGIAPLPPPPGMAQSTPAAGISPLPPAQQKTSTTNSPSVAPAQPAAATSTQTQEQKPTPPTQASSVAPASSSSTKAESAKAPSSRAAGKAPAAPQATEAPKAPVTNGVTNGIKAIEEETDEESIYHLPASLQDLVEAFETTKRKPTEPNSPSTLRMLVASQASAPDAMDSEAPRNYHPDMYYNSPAAYPREPLSIFDDPRLYSRIDPDTLFYVFYYKQGTYQQYLAAKALKT